MTNVRYCLLEPKDLEEELLMVRLSFLETGILYKDDISDKIMNIHV